MKRVLITRSAAQATGLAERLRALKMEPILIPLIEFTEPSSFASLDSAIGALVSSGNRLPESADDSSEDAFHWLIFTSANAVEAFQRRIAGNSNLPPRLKIAAIGPATARALEVNGLYPDCIPAQAIAESLADSLRGDARQPDGSATRFLLIRAEAAPGTLPDALRTAGGQVTIAPAYRTVAPRESVAQMAELFRSRESWPDAITFTSSSTVTNLGLLLEAANLSLPSEVLRISIGPITSQTLRDAGLPPHAEAEAPTLDALAMAIARAIGIDGRP